MFTPRPELLPLLPTPLTSFDSRLNNNMFRHRPEKELFYIPHKELDKKSYPGTDFLDPLKRFSIFELPALEAAVAARGEIVDDFAMVVFGCEAQGDLAVGGDEGVRGVVLFDEELDEDEVSKGGGEHEGGAEGGCCG